ncbi:S1 RNA-binding domain-containing protein [Achromobacter xylosoxidans]
METLNDLYPGMVLEGVVTNVANFGAFVDIGVHQDGRSTSRRSPRSSSRILATWCAWARP